MAQVEFIGIEAYGTTGTVNLALDLAYHQTADSLNEEQTNDQIVIGDVSVPSLGMSVTGQRRFERGMSVALTELHTSARISSWKWIPSQNTHGRYYIEFRNEGRLFKVLYRVLLGRENDQTRMSESFENPVPRHPNNESTHTALCDPNGMILEYQEAGGIQALLYNFAVGDERTRPEHDHYLQTSIIDFLFDENLKPVTRIYGITDRQGDAGSDVFDGANWTGRGNWRLSRKRAEYVRSLLQAIVNREYNHRLISIDGSRPPSIPIVIVERGEEVAIRLGDLDGTDNPCARGVFIESISVPAPTTENPFHTTEYPSSATGFPEDASPGAIAREEAQKKVIEEITDRFRDELIDGVEWETTEGVTIGLEALGEAISIIGLFKLAGIIGEELYELAEADKRIRAEGFGHAFAANLIAETVFNSTDIHRLKGDAWRYVNSCLFSDHKYLRRLGELLRDAANEALEKCKKAMERVHANQDNPEPGAVRFRSPIELADTLVQGIRNSESIGVVLFMLAYHKAWKEHCTFFDMDVNSVDLTPPNSSE